jgi:hypothetical protein
LFWRTVAGGQDAEGGLENIPLRPQMEDFVAQSLVLGPKLADMVKRAVGFLRQGGRVFPLPGSQVPRAEAQFGGDFFQAPAAVVEEVGGGLFERFVVLSALFYVALHKMVSIARSRVSLSALLSVLLIVRAKVF